MINVEIMWAIAAVVSGSVVFYFANTSEISNGKKTWVALFAGFLLSMGLVSFLFMSENLCYECQEYCPCVGGDCE